MKQRHYSLRRRLLVSATILLLLFFGLLGWIFNAAFKDTVLSNAEANLRNQVLLLMSNIDVLDAHIEVSPVLSEARLSQADSNLFAQINYADNRLAWRSVSLLDRSFGLRHSDPGKFVFMPFVTDLGEQSLHMVRFTALWETDNGDLPITIQIAETTDAYDQRLYHFQRQLLVWLTISGFALIGLLWLLLSWGLQPLVKVSWQVAEIEQGERQRFSEDYPREVSRLTQNLNQLLSFEEQRITRQKEILANLAHSLKTPIAIMQGLRYSDDNRGEARQQLDAMQRIIDYQLQSASAVGRRRFAKPVLIEQATRKIISSMHKLYNDKNIDCQLTITPHTMFYGDEGDWLELAGNLIENAFKWAQTRVEVRVESKSTNNRRPGIRLIVTDDGLGIDDEQKQFILQRGVRLDNQTPGHGLGLHIVKGIVEAYAGTIEISDQQTGGTRFLCDLH